MSSVFPYHSSLFRLRSRPRLRYDFIPSDALLTPRISFLVRRRNYLSKEWFLQRSTWGQSDLAAQIGAILGPREGEKLEKPLPSPPKDDESEKAV